MQKFGYRLVCCVGGILTATGFIISAFAPHYNLLYFSFAFVSGNFYLLQTKLREGNVFTHVCLFTGGLPSHNAMRQADTHPWPGDRPLPLPAQEAVGIQLECIFVYCKNAKKNIEVDALSGRICIIFMRSC